MIEFIQQFGGKIDASEKEKLAKSNNWNGKSFENLIPTSMDINLKTLPSLLKKQFTNTSQREPKKNIPILPFEKKEFLAKEDAFIWYGHSVLLMRLAAKSILIDPMFGPDASPIAPIQTKRFSSNSLDIIDSLPKIDAVFMSHDHYDHLDFASYNKLKSKVQHFYVPLGVARHLKAWGIEASKITELDWWESDYLDDLHFTFTPSRHFTGRGLTDRAKSLWGGYTFKSQSLNIYFSGDGGYGPHFKEIGAKLGPFDFAFLECGQYNEEWHQIHMYPEESVQAGMEVKAAKVLPIHWGGFKLALHPWKEPVERFTKEAQRLKLPYLTPQIGAINSFKEDTISENWWKNQE